MNRDTKLKIIAIGVFMLGPILAAFIPTEIGWVGWCAGIVSGYFAADIWPIKD